MNRAARAGGGRSARRGSGSGGPAQVRTRERGTAAWPGGGPGVRPGGPAGGAGWAARGVLADDGGPGAIPPAKEEVPPDTGATNVDGEGVAGFLVDAGRGPEQERASGGVTRAGGEASPCQDATVRGYVTVPWSPYWSARHGRPGLGNPRIALRNRLVEQVERGPVTNAQQVMLLPQLPDQRLCSAARLRYSFSWADGPHGVVLLPGAGCHHDDPGRDPGHVADPIGPLEVGRYADPGAPPLPTATSTPPTATPPWSQRRARSC